MTNQNSSTTGTRANAGARPLKWVSFVGSGPGDPGLLTVRALELLREAEIIVTEVPGHEALVRMVLDLPPAPEPTTGEDARPRRQHGPSSSTAASARTASR